MSKIIILVSATLLLAWAWAAQKQEQEPVSKQTLETIPPQFFDRVVTLEREAIDNAFRLHIQALYGSWMKDDSGQPQRAKRGEMQARKAYIESMLALDEAIERRKQ